MEKLLYSTSEVAELFKVSRVTVYRWIKGGRVSACEIGKHFKIPADEVARMARDFGITGGLYLDLFRGGSGKGPETSVELPDIPGEGMKLVVALAETGPLRDRMFGAFQNGWPARHCRLMVISDPVEAALAVGRTNPDLLLVGLDGDAESGIGFVGTVKKYFDRISVLFVVESGKHGGFDPGDVPGIAGAEVVDVSSGSAALQHVLTKILTVASEDHGQTGSGSNGNTKGPMS